MNYGRQDKYRHDNVQSEERGIRNQGKNQGAIHAILKELDSIPDPEKRYILKEPIGIGVCGNVYEAIDQQASKQKKKKECRSRNTNLILLNIQ